MKTQYLNANNISARIRLHKEFSTNPQGWFPWLFEQCHIWPGMKILELGCGNSALWSENLDKIPKNVHIILSDISEGMLRDAKRNLPPEHPAFSFAEFDCHEIPYPDETFDLVIANHLLFYCHDIDMVCREVFRVLKAGGIFLCSTYGHQHMKEITRLVQSFDSRIVLSHENLYERFGLENGAALLKTVFSDVSCKRYEDSIELNQPEPLIEYILSCHGNQNQILLDRYQDFRPFVEKKVRQNFHITKDAGTFLCTK